MKKALILIMCALSIIFLASCGIQEKIGQLSDQIKDQIIDIAGDFIMKDTGEVKDSSEDASPDVSVPEESIPSQDEVISSTPTISEPSTDIPDEPNEPEVPEVPEYIFLERCKYPINKYIGFDIVKADNKIIEKEYKYREIFGYGRFNTTLVDMESFSSNTHPFSYFKINSIESVLSVDFDLSTVKGEPAEGEYTFKEMATRVLSFASHFCSTSNTMSNLRRIVIGSNPDEKISAKDYALLLNTIYDDNCKQNGENVGTTFVNPEIRLVTGKMSTYNLPYINAVMSACKNGRNDSFLPVGGWAFSAKSQGASPEEIFLRNDSLNQLLYYRDKNYGNIEIYISDFTWDTENAESENYVAPVGSYSSEEIQAMYILRSYLILNGMGVDKASYGAINDTDTKGEGVIKLDGTKKVAFNVLKFFKSKMNGMYIADIISNGESDVYCYKLQDENGKAIYAIWSSADTNCNLSGITGNAVISTYSSSEGGYVDSEREIGDSLTLDVNGFITFVEICE